MNIQINIPDFNTIRQNIATGPESIGGLKKELLLETLHILESQWEAVEVIPLSKEKVRHIRPSELKGLPKTVEICGADIFIFNKGKKTKKAGIGFFKETVRGAHLNTLKSVIQATIRYEDKPDYKMPKDTIRQLIEKEIRLQNYFKGKASVVEINHLCTYPTKEKQERPIVEKMGITMDDCDRGELYDVLLDDEFCGRYFHDNLKNVMSAVRNMIDMLVILEELAVLHRDIKDENIFLKTKEDGSLEFKLGDFGLGGTVLEETERLQKAGEGIGGSAEYLSPNLLNASEKILDADEDFRKVNHDIIEDLCSHKNDVWSMGVVLYNFILGEMPSFSYNEESIKNLTQEILDLDLELNLNSEKVFWESLSDQDETQHLLFKLIRGMLHVDPAGRLSGSELKRLLPDIQ